MGISTGVRFTEGTDGKKDMAVIGSKKRWIGVEEALQHVGLAISDISMIVGFGELAAKIAQAANGNLKPIDMSKADMELEEDEYRGEKYRLVLKDWNEVISNLDHILIKAKPKESKSGSAAELNVTDQNGNKINL